MSTLREDLVKFRELKQDSTAKNAAAKQAKELKEQQEYRCLDRMQNDEDEVIDRQGSGGSLFTLVEKVKGVVNDKSAFIAWALENEPDLVQYEPRQEKINAKVNQLLDDAVEEWPPGLTFRNANYVSVTTR